MDDHRTKAADAGEQFIDQLVQPNWPWAIIVGTGAIYLIARIAPVLIHGLPLAR